MYLSKKLHVGLDHLHHVGRDLIHLLEAADVQRQQNLLILSEPNVKGQETFRPLRKPTSHSDSRCHRADIR